MKPQAEVYLFGQVLGTHSFLLKDGFLKPDEYAEIREQYFLPGGETGTAAMVLSSLGVSVRMDGTWIGTEVAPMLKAFYAEKQVDISPLHFMDGDPGVMDYVVIAGLVRFAGACSAIAISRFPLPLHPPTLDEVRALIGKQA
ncbi:MAG: hypothetical protein IKQ41_03865 [Clostridia bacterium]|nr:hypothetical protein [Clostridia bacterium]